MRSTVPGFLRSLPPKARADRRWLFALGALAVVLFGVGLGVRLHCRLNGCQWSQDRIFDLDALGGLPRLFTTSVFAAAAVLAWRARRLCTGQTANWWTAVAVIDAALTVLKYASAHSVAKAAADVATLVVGVVLSVVVLGALWWTARRWDVPAGPPLVVAFAAYAFAALGLDAVSGAVAAIPGAAGVVAHSIATFVEEFGEALGALFVLAMVWWWLPSQQPVPA